MGKQNLSAKVCSRMLSRQLLIMLLPIGGLGTIGGQPETRHGIAIAYGGGRPRQLLRLAAHRVSTPASDPPAAACHIVLQGVRHQLETSLTSLGAWAAPHANPHAAPPMLHPLCCNPSWPSLCHIPTSCYPNPNLDPNQFT